MTEDNQSLMENVDAAMAQILETVTFPGPSAFQSADQFRIAMAKEFFIEHEDALCWCIKHPIKIFQDNERTTIKPMITKNTAAEIWSAYNEIENGEKLIRLFDVQPALAIAVIRAHVAEQKSILITLNQIAKTEFENSPCAPPPNP